MKISASMIVKNEESVLEKCLQSLEGVDEIVILDTGSTDATSQIARKYTNKYFPNIYKWRDDFAEARNISLNLCTGDWVMVMDADEYWEEGAIPKLRAYLETTPHRVINVKCVDNVNKAGHYLPRVWRRAPDICWKGKIHNYLSAAGDIQWDDAHIWYGRSAAHSLDPDRAFRILKKVCAETPDVCREWFYLAREYGYRAMWNEAIEHYKIYLKRGMWAPEIAEAHYQLSKCLFNVMRGPEARDECMNAIAINTNFKEAIDWMAYITGPKNRERWLEFSESATDEDTLFGAALNEFPVSFWDTWPGTDNTKYAEVWKQVAEWVGDRRCLDIGCGTAEISKLIKQYSGFDFSKEAIEKAKKIAPTSLLWVGNVYESKNYKNNYDVLTAIRVMEYVRDREFIQLIHRGSEFIFTAPSFPGGMRFYTERSIRRRLGDLIELQEVIKFSESPKDGFSRTAPDSYSDYVLLCKSRRK